MNSTLGESAVIAVERFYAGFNEGRKLRAYIRGVKPEPLNVDLNAVRAGKSFILSELYGLPLDESTECVCFRACRTGEADPPPFGRVKGVFDFTRELFTAQSEALSRRESILRSWSKSLDVALFRYKRGTELLIARLPLNSVDAVTAEERVNIPLRELSSEGRMSHFKHMGFNVKYATVDVSSCDLRKLETMYSDFNMPMPERKASYKKDAEVVSNRPADFRISDIATIRALAAAYNPVSEPVRGRGGVKLK
jgi:hypothetical protein